MNRLYFYTKLEKNIGFVPWLSRSLVLREHFPGRLVNGDYRLNRDLI